MGEVDQDLQPVGDDPVRFFAFDVADHADPAGIGLETRVLEPPGCEDA